MVAIPSKKEIASMVSAHYRICRPFAGRIGKVEFSDAMKEMQRTGSGKARVQKWILSIRRIMKTVLLRVYTTRPDTIFGVDFMVIAPEHELVDRSQPMSRKKQLKNIFDLCKKPQRTGTHGRSKKITGCFTGAYALIHLMAGNSDLDFGICVGRLWYRRYYGRALWR